MTVLIGQVEGNRILITGDTKCTHIRDSKNLDTFEKVKKVYAISENVLIGIGGNNKL